MDGMTFCNICAIVKSNENCDNSGSDGMTI
jgi:hypothetical protein